MVEDKNTKQQQFLCFKCNPTRGIQKTFDSFCCKKEIDPSEERLLHPLNSRELNDFLLMPGGIST